MKTSTPKRPFGSGAMRWLAWIGIGLPLLAAAMFAWSCVFVLSALPDGPARDEASKTMIVGGIAVVALVGICEYALWAARVRMRRMVRLANRITLDRHAWRERTRLRAERQAERRLQDSLGRFARGAAHDLNNVLAMVLAGSDDLNASENGPDANPSDVIARAVEEGFGLSRRLIAITSDAPIATKPCDVVSTLAEARDRFIGAAGGSERLSFEMPSRPLMAVVDAERMIGAVIELIANARYASAPQRIALRIKLSERDGHGEPGDGPLQIALEVEDRGHGMTPDAARRATEPFYSTRQNATGLGLTLCARFVADAGGRLDIRSNVGRGTTVSMLLPLLDATASASARPTLAIVEEGARILVVDDSATLRGFLARRLREHGFAVTEAEDASAARRLLTNDDFVALVTDVVLPGGVSGIELAQWARARDAGLALVFVSGFLSARQPELLASDELASFLRKPIDVEGLLAVLHGLLAVRAQRIERPAAIAPLDSGRGLPR